MLNLNSRWVQVFFFVGIITLLQIFLYYSFLSTQEDYVRCSKIFEDNRKIDFKASNFGSEKVKAAFVILARNSDLDGLHGTILQLESHFNKRFKYPYVFLNDAVFTEEFKSGILKLTDSDVKFGQVPKEHWSYPEWIDQDKAREARKDMAERKIIYGSSESYRHMCRFNSGFFFRHPLLAEFEYYWRVEPDVKFFCDINYDPFLFMKKNNKKYGFTIMMPEFMATIPTLWETTSTYIEANKDKLPENNSMKMLIQKGKYNGCHFWSNFEIASLDFFRSKEYIEYFEHLDKQGGFFYERWGDAPVHTLGLSMLLPYDQIHYFADIGYFHPPYSNCPSNPALQLNCSCDPEKNVRKNNRCHDLYQMYSRAPI